MTTVTIYCSNSGLAIQNLGIYDVVADRMQDVGYIAANDVKEVRGLQVRDASTLVAEIEIYHDGVQKYVDLRIVQGGNVDVCTGRVG